MRKSTKLSDALHLLFHMAQSDKPITSENLAKSIQTNSVVVRNMMAGLRNNGLVISEKGHNGGWLLSCDLSAVTLHDIYIAIGSPPIIAVGNRNSSPGCRVENAVNEATNNAFISAESALLTNLRTTTLAEVYRVIETPEGTER